MEELFKKYIELSNSLRSRYKNSLGTSKNHNSILKDLPTPLRIIYSIVEGTNYEVEDQTLMDFYPGFLLININEFNNFLSTFRENYEETAYFPFLVNYSSDFYLLKVDKMNNDIGVYISTNDDIDIIKIHNSFEDFLKTLIAFYERNVFFLDDDGYLDMDFDKHIIIGQEMNPDVEYWFEE
jgi:hypothetical protein